jgi:tRNA threonylcarbamoyl adenosine modification protein (Sua5/YciO/YrdC/YwlC family)
MKKYSIEEAIELIKNEEVIALPTETVYGLFGRANSKNAVSDVYCIKKRPYDNPLICHFYCFEQILNHTTDIPQYLQVLIQEFSPGPLTYLLNLSSTSDLQPATAKQTKVCCRIPNHPITLKILKEVNIPLFGPSANSSTKVSGIKTTQIRRDLGKYMMGYVEGGRSDLGIESTIIDCSNPDQVTIIRPGIIGQLEIEKCLAKAGFGNIKVLENYNTASVTPGAKYKHYAPNTTLIPFYKTAINLPPDCVVVAFGKDMKLVHNTDNKINLGFITKGDVIAKNFYNNLLQIDKYNQSVAYFFVGPTAIRSIRSNDSTIKAIWNKLKKVMNIDHLDILE